MKSDEAHAPVVQWHEYSAEAFALARRLGRPVLVDVGALWCHWCHVMDRATYARPEVMRLLNERYVAIRVDRDRRPDIDRRLQGAVASYQLRATGQASGGWPLTAFLTPTGALLHGETYIPPERFLQVAGAVADYYRDHRGEVTAREAAMAHLMAARRSAAPPAGRRVPEDVVDAVVASLRRQFDARHGGFGTAPKFPAPTAVRLLLRAAQDRHEQDLLGMALKTLVAMAQGGIRDHVGGGFHRYSVDARWGVPHFEKILDVNVGLLDVCLDFLRTVDAPLALDAALGTIRFLDEVLSDRERGGFFGSQDADVGPDDDGAYFTWSLPAFRAAVPEDVQALAASYFGLAEGGNREAFDGHTRTPTEQNVLHATRSIEQWAAVHEVTTEAARQAIDRALEALRRARAARTAPAVDRTIFVDWNAAAVSAYLKAGVVLGREDCRAFALKTVERLLAEGYDPERGMAHVLPPDGAAADHGHLADNAAFAGALLDAYEHTGERRYLDTAQALVDLTCTTLWDEQAGGFFDAPQREDAVGILKQPHKDVQDGSLPSGNAAAIDALIRLAQLTGREACRDQAASALASLGDLPKHLGSMAAGLALAIDRLERPPSHLVIVGDRQDQRTHALHRAALGVDRPRRIVQVLDPQRDGDLLQALGHRPLEAPGLLVCGRGFCLEPVLDPADLAARLNELDRRNAGLGGP